MNWEQIHEKVAPEFEVLTEDKALQTKALELLQTWLEQNVFTEQREPILAHIHEGKYNLLLDAFYQYVPFGTGGRRGRVGYGPNRINSVTVALSVQGHSTYLKQTVKQEPISVVVAYDTRIFRDLGGQLSFLGKDHRILGLSSQQLARQACEIYAANGITAYIGSLEQDSTRYLPTPELSYSIRHLNAAGGVNMSASHNHPDDNGFKFFNSQGAQDIPPHDEELASYQDDIREVHRMPFQQGVDQGLIQEIPPEVREAYLAINLALGEKAPEGASPIVYTPLCGTGDASVGEVLRRAGYPVALYGPQANYDGTFASVASRLPNPEIPQAAQASLQMPEAQDAVLALSTDPDADRLGAYAKDSQGSWRFLTGNDIATLLTYYQVLDKERGPGKNGVIIKSLVTTRSLEEIARRAGCQSVDDLLVGFKYIAHVLDCLERTGRFRHVQAKPKNLVLACEESHGFLLTEQIRDKDAAGAAIVLCELSAKLEKEGKRLPEYLEQAQVELGNYVNSARSVVMRGIAGMEAMVKLMSSLRAKPFESFGGLPVRGFEDFRDEKLHGPILSKTDFSARNLLLYRLDGAQVVIRPSGTEPKLKIYVDVEGQAFGCKTRQEALQSASRVGAQVFRALLDRAEVKLSDSASELPDYVDIDLKQGFDSEFRKKLEAAAPQLAEKSKEEQMEWLRSELAPYAPGADPLVATRAALIHLCVALAESSENGPVHDFYVGLATALEQ